MEGDARQIASTAEDSANSRSLFVLWRFSSEVVGATGFEPATPCAQGRCATRLRYAPTSSGPSIVEHFPLVVTWIVLAGIVIAFPSVCLQQTLAAVGEEHCHVPLTRHPSRVDEAQFPEVAELGVPRVQGPIVAVAEVLGWDNTERADGRQSATLRTAQRVLTVAVEYALALGSAGKVELA